jgi:site-specific DNA recombinase
MVKAITKPLAEYRRVSRQGERADDRFRSPDFQRQEIARFVKDEGFKLERFEPEIDVSGSKVKRPILDEIVRRIEAGELGGIVVAKLDRLARLKPKDRVLLFDRIESAGGVVLSASEPLDPSTPTGRYMREQFLSLARLEWEQKAEVIERSKAEAVRNGIPVNTRQAPGIRQRKDRRLEQDPRTAPIMREFFERRVRGDGPTALGRFLEGNRVKTSQGSKAWSKQAVMEVIRNPIYKGLIRYGRDNRYVNEDGVIGGPIVDAATWQAAQHPTPKLAPARNGNGGYLLAGILRCHACRHCLQGTVSGRGKRVYRCTRRHAGGECPEPAYVDAATVEDAVIAEFWRRTRNLEARAVRDDSGQLAALQAEYEKAQRRVSELETPEAQDALGERYFAVWRERIAARDDAARRLGEAQHAAPEELPDAETLRGAWDRMTTQDRRELLHVRFHALALSRSRRLAVYPAGADVGDLPRRGYRRNVRELVPFPDPPRGIRILAL